jgi:hypothetical protein
MLALPLTALNNAIRQSSDAVTTDVCVVMTATMIVENSKQNSMSLQQPVTRLPVISLFGHTQL